jgi:hypothetical protein
MSYTAMEKYGDLGRLIEQGTYYAGTPPVLTNFDFANDPYQLNRAQYIEEYKNYTKHQEEMKNNRPRLYALLMQYLSPESKDEIKRTPDYPTMKQNRDPLMLWEAIEATHKVHSITKVAAVVKRSARKEYTGIKQGPYESIIAYRERFNETLKAYAEQENPEEEEVDISMDFFDGLDNARYAAFKVSILNGLTTGAVTQPETLNEMYLLANQWVKTTGAGQTGLATTFVTKVDMPEKPAGGRKGQKKEKEREKNKEMKEDKDGTSPKPKRDPAKVKCFECGERGHYANACPTKTDVDQPQTEKDTSVYPTWAEYDQASTYCTFQVDLAFNPQKGSEGQALVMHARLKRTEVLLDIQADVSIFHPSLLTHLEPVDREVKIAGVGGRQLVVRQTGYLDGFFREYASEEATANVLCLADVEDLYAVTYVPQEYFLVRLPGRVVQFNRQGKLYIADWAEQGYVQVTVAQHRMRPGTC